MKKQTSMLILFAALTVIPIALTTGCASHSAQVTPRQYAADKNLEARIEAAIAADPTFNGTPVTVNALRGQVQLSGFVNNPAARDRAAEIAASTPGVHAVYNDLLTPTGR